MQLTQNLLFIYSTRKLFRLQHTENVPCLFPCKSTSFSPQLSHFLSVSHVHHISFGKSYLLALKQFKENLGSCIMQEGTHQVKIVTVILYQIGPGENRCLAFSTFTFKQGQNTKSDHINHCQCILYTFTMHLNSMSYIQYIM